MDLSRGTEGLLGLLGFDCGKPARYGGDWIERIIGIEDPEVEVVMVQGPDGKDALNRPGLRHVAFQVNDLRSIIDRVREGGWQMTGEIVNYEETFLLCYLRGPEGLIVEHAEKLGGA